MLLSKKTNYYNNKERNKNKKMTKTRLLLLVAALFFTSSQSSQLNNEDIQSVVDRDTYNAFISFVDKKTLTKEIKNIEAMSLTPIALGVKDNIDIVGLPTTAGSIALRNNRPKKMHT
jgi:Asp-tRNA(Asn)/Glu-tRNA(Gln) amidotransferase A subunit family amidase